MGIKIVLPEGDGLKTGHGTKVYTANGVEISGICRMSITVAPDEIIMAAIEVSVDDITNVDGIASLLPPDQAMQVLKWAKQLSTATEA